MQPCRLRSVYPPPESPEQSVGSSETTSPEISAPPAVSSKPAGFDADAVVEQLEVREFQHNSRYANYAFVTVKNNSEIEIGRASCRERV